MLDIESALAVERYVNAFPENKIQICGRSVYCARHDGGGVEEEEEEGMITTHRIIILPLLGIPMMRRQHLPGELRHIPIINLLQVNNKVQ